MAPKTIATLLILFALSTMGANDASAQGRGLGTAGRVAAVSEAAAFRVGAVANFRDAAPIGTASTDEAFTDEDSTDQASLDLESWMAPDTGTTMGIPTGTESPPVTIRALSSASV